MKLGKIKRVLVIMFRINFYANGLYTKKWATLADFISIFLLSDLNMSSLCISTGFKNFE